MQITASENKELLDVGLGLHHINRNEEVIEYSKNVENIWFFSKKTKEVLRSYKRIFPELFAYLVKHPKAMQVTDVAVFGSHYRDRAQQLKEYAAQLPTTGALQQVIPTLI